MAPALTSPTSLPLERVRAPDPAKRVAPGNPALDEIRYAVDRDVLRKEAKRRLEADHDGRGKKVKRD